MGTKDIINYVKGELEGLVKSLEVLNNSTPDMGISLYKDLALDLARVACWVSCALAQRDAPTITQLKRSKHQRELKQALREQHELVVAIFNNDKK